MIEWVLILSVMLSTPVPSSLMDRVDEPEFFVVTGEVRSEFDSKTHCLQALMAVVNESRSNDNVDVVGECVEKAIEE